MVSALVASVIALGGCATATRPAPIMAGPAAPSEDVLASLGTIGVVARGAVETSVSPVTPRGQAAKRGAREAGVGTFAGFTLTCLQPTEWFLLQLVACPVAGALVAPIGAGVGAVVEAARYESRSTIDAAPDIIRKAALESHLPRAAQVQVARLGNEWTRWRASRFVDLGEEAGAGLVTDRVTMAERGVDTVLDLNVSTVWLVGGESNRLRLAVTLEARLLRVEGMEVIHAHALQWESAPRRLRDWLAADARPLRETAQQAMRELAARVLDEVLLLFPPLAEVAATEPRVGERIRFVHQDTTRKETLDRLGEPHRRYEGGRIVTYAMWMDRQGDLRTSTPPPDAGRRYRLIVVFDADDRVAESRVESLETRR